MMQSQVNNNENNNNDLLVLCRNQYIQLSNHLATMVSKTIPSVTGGVKEPSIKSTRAADQTGVMNVIIDGKLK